MSNTIKESIVPSPGIRGSFKKRILVLDYGNNVAAL
jgi:hypothetical protein